MRPLVASASGQAHHCHAFACKNQVPCPPPPPTDYSTSRWQIWYIGTYLFDRDWVLAVVLKLIKIKRDCHERGTCRKPEAHNHRSSQGSKKHIFAPFYWLTLDYFWCSFLNVFFFSSRIRSIHPSSHPSCLFTLSTLGVLICEFPPSIQNFVLYKHTFMEKIVKIKTENSV